MSWCWRNPRRPLRGFAWGRAWAHTHAQGDVVDFAVNKTAAETALKGGNYAQAESSYASSLKVMEAMLDKLPPDKAAEIQAKLDAVRQNMKAELGTKTAEGN